MVEEEYKEQRKSALPLLKACTHNCRNDCVSDYEIKSFLHGMTPKVSNSLWKPSSTRNNHITIKKYFLR